VAPIEGEGYLGRERIEGIGGYILFYQFPEGAGGEGGFGVDRFNFPFFGDNPRLGDLSLLQLPPDKNLLPLLEIFPIPTGDFKIDTLHNPVEVEEVESDFDNFFILMDR
jgi:hypothetical protein